MADKFITVDSSTGDPYLSGLTVGIGGTVKENIGWSLTSTSGAWSFGSVDVSGRQIINYDVPVFTGATSSIAGSTGLVPQPAAGSEGKYLRGDSTWQTITPGISTVGTNVIGTGVYTSVNGIAFQAGTNTTVSYGGTDGNGRPIVKVNAASGAPSGTDTQTLYYNGTTLTATSGVRVNSSGHVGIGVAPQSSEHLYVSTSGSNTAIASDTSSGIAMQGYSGSGTGVKGLCSSGKGGHFTTSGGYAVYATASSGYAGYFESDSGYGTYSYSKSSYGGQFRSLQHGAFYADQYGTLTANNTVPAMSIVRNLTLGSYTAAAPLLWMRDITGSGGKFIELNDSSNAVVFSVDGVGRTRTRVLNQDTETATTLAAGDNHDISLGGNGILHLTNDPSTTGVTGFSGGEAGDWLTVESDDLLLMRHNTGSLTGNRIWIQSGISGLSGFRFKFRKRADGYWWLISYW